MRGSGWWPTILAALLFTAAVVAPAVALIGEATASASVPIDPALEDGFTPVGKVLMTTLSMAGIVALLATLLGWGPGRVLARGPRWVMPLVTIPIAVPAYAVFYAWWQAWPPDSAIFAFAVERDLVGVLRVVTLGVALTCWSWPIVAWTVAAAHRTRSRADEERLALDGAGWWPCQRDRLRHDAPGLWLGAAVVFLLAAGNTTSFDLAQMFSFGNELRARDALGAPVSAIVAAAWPALVGAGLGAWLVWRKLGVLVDRGPARSPSASRHGVVLLLVIWTLTVAIPYGWLVTRLADWGAVRTFFSLYGRELASSGMVAAVTGGLGALVAVGLALGWSDARRWVRRASDLQAIGWALAAFVPATLVALGLEAAYNRPTLAASVYDTAAILGLGGLARAGLVAALVGRWVAATEAPSIRDLRQLDGATNLPGLWTTMKPRLGVAALTAGVLITVLSLAEVPVTARIHPPGTQPLALSLLSDMHYQRPQAVIVAVIIFLTLASAAAVLATACTRHVALTGIALSVLLLGGCGRGDEPRPLDTEWTFASTGISLGQLSYPRAIAADEAGDAVYVIDKTARVQRFALDGTPQIQWRMPAKEKGKPTGITVAPDGRVLVADTHYHRVIIYDRDGNELLRFGSYGEEPGQFIYPTCVVIGPEDRLYVAEYGGNDRIQVFSPDGEWLFAFGRFGAGDGAFDRPQAILFDEKREELFVADACNHRIVVVDAEGTWRRTFGTAGAAAGELHYPYGLTWLPDGDLMVCEFGNNRLQRFSRDGRPQGRMGTLGAGEGELRYPWDVEATSRWMFVLDSGNNRVQVIRTP